MTGTQLLQEIRQMRFVEAYVGWQEQRLSLGAGARLLGVCDRMFRRYVDRYEDEGLPSSLYTDRVRPASTLRESVHVVTRR